MPRNSGKKVILSHRQKRYISIEWAPVLMWFEYNQHNNAWWPGGQWLSFLFFFRADYDDVAAGLRLSVMLTEHAEKKLWKKKRKDVVKMIILGNLVRCARKSFIVTHFFYLFADGWSFGCENGASFCAKSGAAYRIAPLWGTCVNRPAWIGPTTR